MTKKLEDKVAIVTGSGSKIGIGRAVALALAQEGARVVVNDFGKDPDGSRSADRVVGEITKAGGIAAPNYDSVTSTAGGESIINTAITEFGKIDILVNCAGNAQRTPTLELTEAEWDSIIAVHLKGHFACTRAAVPHMIKQKSGRIITFTSRGAFDGKQAAYSAAKAGILGYTNAMAETLRPYNITVNAISPSAVTELFTRDLNLRAGKDNLPRSSPKAGADFVAPAVVYLATDAAQAITGRTIYASAGDICLYVHPFRLSAANVFVRKQGKWTVDELEEIVPPLLGLG